ncbi:hypothetical protein CHS0354_004613 [Potamilus streckersoni]|uniref:CBF1-interacting co-repressor CIR N-terminal domain-containing protein n=1 Tax=Potamilus streckersoni TaxID=2493646 RepID=A0AAE0VPD5_9BIVA|nr:hypothetical protein CHS0354_004613 [Potamilus streckersoni]
MNILPKKSWHVRNKKNIERVRRDEEKAAEEEKERQRKIALAEQEARTEFLRTQTRKRKLECHVETDGLGDKALTSTSTENSSIYTASGHINFFQEDEAGIKKSGKNVENAAEKKAEKEKWEKDIGLLTYLGQSSVESQSKPPWYLDKKKMNLGEGDSVKSMLVISKDEKLKYALDPIHKMHSYLEKKSHKDKSKQKHKKHKHEHKRHKDSEREKDKEHSSTSKTIAQLRAERLKREQSEVERERMLRENEKVGGSSAEVHFEEISDRDRRYNSQFNPDFVRQPRPKTADYRKYLDT